MRSAVSHKTKNPSWCDSFCQHFPTFWLKMPSGIPAAAVGHLGATGAAAARLCHYPRRNCMCTRPPDGEQAPSPPVPTALHEQTPPTPPLMHFSAKTMRRSTSLRRHTARERENANWNLRAADVAAHGRDSSRLNLKTNQREIAIAENAC